MHPLVQQFFRSRLYQHLMALCLTAILAGMPLSTAYSDEKLSDFLELRGYIRIGGVLEFSVYNKRDNRSEWLRVNDKHRGYTIENYDSERNEIQITYNGMTGVLPLQASQIADYVETVAASVQPGNKNPTSGGSRPEAAPPTSAQRRSDQGRRTPQLHAAAGNRASVSHATPTPTGGFPPGRSHSRTPALPPPPQTPPSNGQPPPATGEPPQGGPDLSDPYWESMQAPPPVPSSTPPVYSPEA